MPGEYVRVGAGWKWGLRELTMGPAGALSTPPVQEVQPNPAFQSSPGIPST
jgi:hypothetical protein